MASSRTCMASKFVLALDIGTSAVKAVLFDMAARQVCLARRSYPLITPRSGWNEQDPDLILERTAEAASEALRAIQSDELVGVVLSCQMVSMLAVDRTGKPLTNIQTWSDTRGRSMVEVYKNSPESVNLHKITGCPLESIYWPAKIRCMLENHVTGPESIYLSVKDYVLFYLTGRFITDWSMASCTGLMDIRHFAWSKEALEFTMIGESNLPEMLSNRHMETLRSSDFLRKTGIPVGVPLILGSGDAPLSSLGVGALEPDILVVNVGTSTAARKMIKSPSPDGHQQLWTYMLDDTHFVTGGMSSSGGVVYDWYRSRFSTPGEETSFERLETEAVETTPGADGLLFIPYLTGEQCPTWQADTHGGFHGLEIAHTRGHITRAVLEGITFSIFRIIETILASDQTGVREIRVTGGLGSSALWQQTAADIFGLPLLVSESNEGSARGAAYLALQALGYLTSLDETSRFHVEGTRVDADLKVHELYMLRYREFLQCLPAFRRA
jgi:gluconokinase